MNLSITLPKQTTRLDNVPCLNIYQVISAGVHWLKIHDGSIAMHPNGGWVFVRDASCNLDHEVTIIGKVNWTP